VVEEMLGDAGTSRPYFILLIHEEVLGLHFDPKLKNPVQLIEWKKKKENIWREEKYMKLAQRRQKDLICAYSLPRRTLSFILSSLPQPYR